MSLRPPSRYGSDALSGGTSPNAGLNVLDHEIAGEKAAALGRAGARVEMSLRLLNEAGAGSPDRPTLLKEAAQAVHAYFIHRELCGMRRHHEVIRDYGIPKEVLARLGAS